MKTETDLEFEEKKVSIILSPAYQEWFTDHEAALFPPISQWQDMLIRDTAVRSVGVRAVRGDAIRLPEIKMRADGAPAAVVPQIQNTDRALGAHILSLCHAIHQAEERVGAGTHHFFSGKITIRDADG